MNMSEIVGNRTNNFMNNKRPIVSVIIPTYNRAHLLGRAVGSIINQTYRDFELIIVDDGSTDNTRDVVESVNDNRIKYIRLDRNKGAAAARNAGIEVVKGEFIAFQDSDDEWLREKLEKQMQAFENCPQHVGVVYSDMWRVRENGEVRYWQSPTITNGCIIDAEKLEYRVMGVGLCTTVIRRECLRKAGSFDEKFPRFIDLDLFIRLSQSTGFYHMQEPLVRYYETDGISSNRRAEATARILLLEKYFQSVRKNKKFISNQYFMISKNLYSCLDAIQGRKYLHKAIWACPLYKEPLFLQFKNVFGDNAYLKLRKMCWKTKTAFGRLVHKSA